jgi:hypothetical protein
MQLLIDRLAAEDRGFFIRGRMDVLALWVDVTKRKPGNPTGANQHTKEEEKEGTLDNIQDSTKAPTGTSAAAGLRKLQKAAGEGNEKAQILISHLLLQEYRRRSLFCALRQP